LKFGNARFPMPYNVNHFTYVSDENGIGNRWAGFFSTQRDGLDTLYFVGDDFLRNPSDKELDSTLKAWRKQEPDSISYFQVYKDSTYTFPITNYQSSLIETRYAGAQGQVSETRREGDYKYLYKLRVDSLALRRRNVNARPTEYRRKEIEARRLQEGRAVQTNTAPRDTSKSGVFQSEFENDKTDAGKTGSGRDSVIYRKPPVLENAGLFNYKLKFNADYVLSGVSNNILINRYQPYANGALPVQLNNGNDINWTFRVGVSDIMEDIKVIGGFRFGTSLKDKDAFISLQNFRKRIDWGITYYRSNVNNFLGFYKLSDQRSNYLNNLVTNIYQVNITYPFNEVKSVRITAGLRQDKGIVKPISYALDPNPAALGFTDSIAKSLMARIEYVHDNSLNPTQNIWNGLRWKAYLDINMPTEKGSSNKGNRTFNLGFDARNYVKIFRNFIWAARAAGDFSWGERKILYYLGGVDGWVGPKFHELPRPAGDQSYAYQSLAVNMRGYKQNLANGNNAVVINSEFRLPVFSTLFSKPINNAFIRNFQLVQFTDFGTAWNGKYNGIARPTQTFTNVDPNNLNPVVLKIKAGGIGPFAGGYGFGARSTLLGYFIKFDAGWPMNGFFRGKPVYYFALGVDF
jgi:hypothetical protein